MRKAVMGVAMATGLMAAGTAVAGEFYPISIDDTQVIVLDLESFVAQGGVTTVNFIWVSSEHGEFSGTKIGHIEVQEEHRCATGEARRIGLTLYDTKGVEIGHSDTKMDWAKAEPRTAGALMNLSVCDPSSHDLPTMQLPTAEMVAKAAELMARAKENAD